MTEGSSFAQDGVFAKYETKSYPFQFRGRIDVELLAGGTPTNPDVAEAWIKAKGYQLSGMKDEALANQVATVMHDRGVSEDKAVEEVARNRYLSGFKRDEQGLYIEGRQLKACIKEAGSVAADAGKLKARGFGVTNARKGIISFLAEHVFVINQRLHLNVTEPTDVFQSFVHTFRGSGIQYTEVVEDASFEFVVETDKEFSDEEWGVLWGTAQRQGIGAQRSQGFGRFTVMEWEPIAQVKPLKRQAA